MKIKKQSVIIFIFNDSEYSKSMDNNHRSDINLPDDIDHQVETLNKNISKLSEYFSDETKINIPFSKNNPLEIKKSPSKTSPSISGLAIGIAAANALIAPIAICWGLGKWWDAHHGNILGQMIGVLMGMPIGLLAITLTLSKLQKKKYKE